MYAPSPLYNYCPQHPKWPVYRVMDTDGRIRDGAVDPKLDRDLMLKMYRTVVRLQAMDVIFYNAQRQGRISFYMTSMGEVSGVRECIHPSSWQ